MKSLSVALILGFLVPVFAFAGGSAPAIKLEAVVKGLEPVTFVTSDQTLRLFICEQVGRIRLVENGQLVKQPALDITERVWFQGECGFLSIAFHPRYPTNGRVFAYYITNATKGAPAPAPGKKPKPEYWAVISEFKADVASGRFDPASERVLLKFDERPYSNHKGGQLAFGPDGFLYVGTGDGGLHDDPRDLAQNLSSPLGKMHRIDVDTRGGDKPYGIPTDNPFKNKPGAMPEIYAWGLRNPWRFSWDPATGDMYCADIGQDKWEEIDLITKGGNYGWRGREGFHANPTLGRVFAAGEQDVRDALDPLLEYPHTENNKSITGGYVYRGKAIPALVGWYLYGDYSSGRIWALKQQGGKVVSNIELLHSRTQPSSFGVDAAGEVYVVDYNGAIWKIVAG